MTQIKKAPFDYEYFKAYYNVYNGYIAGHYNSLDEAIEAHCDGAKSVAKLTIVDGKIIKFKTVHNY